MKLYSIDETVSFLKLKIKKEWIITFFSTFIIGLLTHLYLFTNKLPNHDSLYSFYHDQNTWQLGRYLRTFACGITSYFDLPVVNGIFTLIYTSLAAVLLVKIFGIKKKRDGILVGALLATFPALTATMTYMHLVDGFILGLLFAIIAVDLMKNEKINFIVPSIFLACSIAIYQAYLSFAVTLCVFVIILALLKNEKNTSEIEKLILRFILIGVVAMILYFIGLKLSLVIYHGELTSYQNMDSIGKIKLTDLPYSMLKTFYYCFKFIFLLPYMNPNLLTMIIYIVTILIILYISLIFLKDNKIYKDKSRLIILLLFILLGIPFSLNLFTILAPSSEVHALMRYQYVIPFIFVIPLLENFKVAKPKGILVEWISIISLVLLSYNYYLVDNIAYFNMQQKYEKSYATALRIINDLEEFDDFNETTPVAFIGDTRGNEYFNTNISDSVVNLLTGTNGDTFLYEPYHFQQFIKNYIGVNITLIEEENLNQLKKSSEVKEMDLWPNKNSIKEINGVLVIKLSE